MTEHNHAENNNQTDQDQDREKVGTIKANIQLVIVVGLIIAGIFISQNLSGSEERIIEEKKKKNLLVDIVRITPNTRSINFTRTGNIEVDGQINITPQVSGRVVKISKNLNSGGVFAEDEILFNIEKADFINQINIAKAQVEQAQTALSVQQAESDAARAEWSSINPDKSAPDLVARIPQLKQAKASLLAARAQLEEVRLDYNRSKFSYNFPGRVINTTIELGQFIQAGQSYGTAYPINALEVSVPLSDKLLPYVQNNEGGKVLISTNYAGQEIKIEGTIDRIGSTLDQSTRFINVIVKPNKQDWQKLVPGIFVDVKFFGKEINNIWELPTKTIQGQNTIWTVTENNTLQSVKVDIISINNDTALAIGDGSTLRVVNGLLKGGSNGMGVRIKGEENDNQFPNIDSAPQAVGDSK